MGEKTLFFDGAASGHHGEFLENVIFGLSATDSEHSTILAHPDLESGLSALRLAVGSKIQLIFLKADEVGYLEQARGIVQIGRRQLEVLSRYLQNLSVRRVVLMHMNLHQYALHSWRPAKEVSIFGILLNPYTPAERAFGLRAKVFACLTGIRKRLQFKLMLRNPQIERIFLLNDPRMAERLNGWHTKRGNVFSSIPDPLPALSPLAEIPRRDASPQASFRFLLFGSMAPRKGCLEVLNALAVLTKSLSRPIELRMIGCFRTEHPGYREAVMAKIKALVSVDGRIQVTVDDSFVEYSQMSEEFAQADCVLVPYLKFYGSSGMIGHACRYSKPLLTCREGLVSEIVQAQKLGLCVQPRDANAFAAAMTRMIAEDYDYDRESAERYVAQADYKNFTKHLIA